MDGIVPDPRGAVWVEARWFELLANLTEAPVRCVGKMEQEGGGGCDVEEQSWTCVGLQDPYTSK